MATEGHSVGKRAIRILLECFLVIVTFGNYGPICSNFINCWEIFAFLSTPKLATGFASKSLLLYYTESSVYLSIYLWYLLCYLVLINLRLSAFVLRVVVFGNFILSTVVDPGGRGHPPSPGPVKISHKKMTTFVSHIDFMFLPTPSIRYCSSFHVKKMLDSFWSQWVYNSLWSCSRTEGVNGQSWTITVIALRG